MLIISDVRQLALSDNSIDAIVCDPPYGLEFMGKEWDKLSALPRGRTAGMQISKPTIEDANDTPQHRVAIKQPVYLLRCAKCGGNSSGEWNRCQCEVPEFKSRSDLAIGMQQWHYSWAIEAYRVLKPGGWLLAMGGTRTHHRLMCALEDAGFEIRDCLMWVYGCLSEDTEILTLNGWRQYYEITNSTPILCYNINSNSFEFHKPSRKVIYENKHPAYRIQSDNTDQIVSRNHRVLVKRGGELIFKGAETLERQEDIPFLESLPNLSEAISSYYGRTGNKEQRLSRVYKSKVGKMEYGQKETEKENMPHVREGILSNWAECKETSKILFSELCWQGLLLAKKLFGQWQGEEAPRHRIKGRQKSCLEGRGYLFQKARQLWRLQNKIRSVSRRLFGDGTQGWLCHGTPPFDGTENWQAALEEGGSSPQRPQPRKQFGGQFTSFPQQQGTQAIRSTRATITEIKYQGRVWCVEVPTGAFVARRNGKIFVTGNSGFPKSTDISKQLDKMAGAGREVTGRYIAPDGKTRWGGSNPNPMDWGEPSEERRFMKTAPATNLARIWDGWGTALKPAYEPIIMAQKPRDGTFANNVLKWGCGGLNIDACRIGNREQRQYTGAKRISSFGGDAQDYQNPRMYLRSEIPLPTGRWPANLIHDGSDEVLELFPQAREFAGGGQGNEWFNEHRQVNKQYYGDSGSAARFFYTAKAPKRERWFYCRDCKDAFPSKLREDHWHNHLDEKGKKSWEHVMFHPTVKPLSLMEYLVKLVTPPEGIVLDLFCGTGTTLVAADKLGFRWIGCDNDPESVIIAKRRIEAQRLENPQLALAL